MGIEPFDSALSRCPKKSAQSSCLIFSTASPLLIFQDSMVSIVHGGLAQLVERLLRKQEVTGSTPVISTNKNKTCP